MDTKQTNPKDAIGSGKLPLSLVPDIIQIYAAMAFAEGDHKYRGFNWRVAGVRHSIYWDALRRHLMRYQAGEDCDPATGVPHLASAIACIGIILDAQLVGKLNDDRPPPAPGTSAAIESATAVVAEVRRRIGEREVPGPYTRDDV